MQNKLIICKIIIFISLSFLLIYTLIFYNNYHINYKELLDRKNNVVIEGLTAPRGRIFDINGKILVDNKMTNNLVFYNIKGIDKKALSEKLASVFAFDKPTTKEIINWYKDTKNMTRLLSNDEKYEIKKRTLSWDDLLNQKILLLTDSLSNEELNIIKAYALLNNGYDNSPKIIKKNLSDIEVNIIVTMHLPGIEIEVGYERYYPYGNILKSIFGNVGKISLETKEEYLRKGYNLNDIVGLSYLEKYYNDYLKGKKAKYIVNSDNSLTKIKSEKIGNDLYLTIDIDLQMKVEEIVQNNLKKAKKFPNTNYLSDTYVIMSNPKTGEINAFVGQRILDNNEFNNIELGIITSSFTMGSVVKGATMSVALANKVFNPNEKIYDSCVKLKNMTAKCSWKSLGYLDAIKALEQSSNYYQFILAIKMLGRNYQYDMDLSVTNDDFLVYRKMLASYGLGIKTGIDLPNEKIGLIGKTVSPDLYLNLVIGQYDTYTPIELMTYINTLANKGKRLAPHLLGYVKDQNEIVFEYDSDTIETINLENEDYDIIFNGFYNVMNNPNGTGYGYMNRNLNPAGKTGTSESFFDADNDGIIDTSTITLTMAGFYPYDNPSHSMIIISPNVSYINNQSDYVYPLTYFISREITDFMLKNMSSY